MSQRKTRKTVDIVADIFGQATSEVMSAATGEAIFFAPTIQKIPMIHLRPDIGCFVQFGGDYSGLMIINFTRGAALDYYRQSMLFMGLSEEDLTTDHTSDEVVDSIGEVVNQIIGKARKNIQEKYGLSAFNNQPKAISIIDSVTLTIDSLKLQRNNQCRRLSFMTSQKNSFHIELFIEPTEFILINEAALAQNQNTANAYDFEAMKLQEETTLAKSDGFDLDTLVAQTKFESDELDIDALIEKKKSESE